MPKIKVFKNAADPTKKANAIAAFLKRMPKPSDFVGTDEDWIEDVVFRFFQDIVRAGKRALDADQNAPADVTDVV